MPTLLSGDGEAAMQPAAGQRPAALLQAVRAQVIPAPGQQAARCCSMTSSPLSCPAAHRLVLLALHKHGAACRPVEACISWPGCLAVALAQLADILAHRTLECPQELIYILLQSSSPLLDGLGCYC